MKKKNLIKTLNFKNNFRVIVNFLIILKNSQAAIKKPTKKILQVNFNYILTNHTVPQSNKHFDNLTKVKYHHLLIHLILINQTKWCWINNICQILYREMILHLVKYLFLKQTSLIHKWLIDKLMEELMLIKVILLK